MHPLVVHIASGQAFFTGALLILISLLLQRWAAARRRTKIIRSLSLLGLMLAILSSAPLPPLLWITLGCCTLLTLWSPTIARRRASAICISLWLVGCAIEFQWSLSPAISQNPPIKNREIVVLADSVTAGLMEGEAVTWPNLVRQKHGMNVCDYSHVGETAASALKRARTSDISPQALVILEIGGNDLLGHGDSQRFEHDLNQLLQYLTTLGCEVLMFELPLPPFHNRWGAIQREAAVSHGIQLIPRRILASVFSGPTSTLDSIHLSQEGHGRMLGIIERLLDLPEPQKS